MRPVFLVMLLLACFSALFLCCFAPALLEDRQFGFRDAGHFYYPLHARVQKEWNERRWPLWEPEENGGMPLLGNPTAAVLYPGKIVFAVLPYKWAARFYIVAHSLVAFAAMLVLMRSWKTGWGGAGVSALSYTFGAPILFQYCNIIYLVGAAWLPLGVHAVDRWVRLGRRWAILELAIVLALQVLGGDPQVAFLLGIAGLGYALAPTRARLHDTAEDLDPSGTNTTETPRSRFAGGGSRRRGLRGVVRRNRDPGHRAPKIPAAPQRPADTSPALDRRDEHRGARSLAGDRSHLSLPMARSPLAKPFGRDGAWPGSLGHPRDRGHGRAALPGHRVHAADDTCIGAGYS